MNYYWKRLELPLMIGVSSALTGGLVNYLTKINTTVHLNLSSMFRSVFLITTSGMVVIRLKEEYEKLPGPP